MDPVTQVNSDNLFKLLELYGDDANPDTGFLRKDDKGQYSFHLPEKFREKSKDTTQAPYFNFLRFAKTLDCLPALKGQYPELAQKSQNLIQKEDGEYLSSVSCEEFTNAPKINSTRVKVATMNLAEVDDADDKRIKQFANFIWSRDLDIVLLQEITDADAIEALAKASGLRYFVDGTDKDTDLAILSKYPIKEIVYQGPLGTVLSQGPFPWQGSVYGHCGSGFKWGLIVAKVEIDGQEVLVVNQHAMPTQDPINHEQNRTPNRKQLITEGKAPAADEYNVHLSGGRRMQFLYALFNIFMHTKKDMPVIFGGDFNVNSIHWEMQYIYKTLQPLGFQDALYESWSRGVTNYEPANKGRTCDRPNAMETYSFCNPYNSDNALLRFETADSFLPKQVAYFISKHYAAEGVLDHLLMRGVHNFLTYIDRGLDGVSDHYAVISEIAFLKDPSSQTTVETDSGTDSYVAAFLRSVSMDEIQAARHVFGTREISLLCNLGEGSREEFMDFLDAIESSKRAIE